MKILLTGGSGLLGGAIHEVLAANGHSVDIFQGDITDPSSDSFAFPTFDWVIHTAAQTDVAACARDGNQCFSVNVEGTRTMRKIAEKTGARFLYISTASVFDGTKGMYTETDPPNPEGRYNVSKFAGEAVALEYSQSHIVRINIIGIRKNVRPGEIRPNFLEWLAESFEGNRPLTLYTDAEINPLSNLTIAKLIQESIVADQLPQILHLGAKNALSKAAIGTLVQKHFPQYSSTVSLGKQFSESKKGGVAQVHHLTLDSVLAARTLSWSPPSVEEEINAIFTARLKK